MAQAFVNSFAITIPATHHPASRSRLLAAYAFAWMDFRGKSLLFVLVFALQIVPIQMALVPLLQLFSQGTIFGVPVIQAIGVRGFHAGVDRAHDLRAAADDLPAAQLRRRRSRTR